MPSIDALVHGQSVSATASSFNTTGRPSHVRRPQRDAEATAVSCSNYRPLHWLHQTVRVSKYRYLIKSV